MRLIDGIRTWFAGSEEPAAEVEETKLREAAGVTIDDDEDQWRALSTDKRRDLTPLTQRRMQDLAVYQWETNLVANRLIELPLAYLLAEGVRLTSGDPEAQDWLDTFWSDPINAWDIKLPKRVRELHLFGEACWPVFVNEIDGHVRVGYLDPSLIETVVTDPDNVEQPIGVVTVKDKKGRSKRYRVILNGEDSELFDEAAQRIRATFTDGDCFYFRVNELCAGRRGRSDLLASIDWTDAYEQFLFGEIERSNFLRAYIWDITLTGATPEDVKRRAKEIKTPAPGSARVHNEQETWKAESPSLQAAESDSMARLLRNHLLGGSTIPEHWYGGGGDVNRATAGEMGEPTLKILSMRQRSLKYLLEEMGQFVIRQRTLKLAGAEPSQVLKAGADRPEAVFPEMSPKDTTKYATALSQVVVAVSAGIAQGVITEQTGVELIAAIAGRLGVDIDPAEELEKARAEAAARRGEEEPFPDLPDDPAEDPSGDPDQDIEDPVDRAA